MKKKLKKIMINNWSILLLLIVIIILHCFAFLELGYDYNLNSDDISYINSGITFFKTGQITMHGDISAQIMPGMTFLIAFFCLIFGTGNLLMLSLKIFWIFMGVLSVFILYKIIRLYTNQYAATIGCVFFLSLDYIWMNNLILTETPFILTFMLLIYHSLRLSLYRRKKDYILIIVWYILCLFIRPNIALFPVFLFIYLIICKYDIKLLIKQAFIAGGILLVLLIPWMYRNYKLFDTFIPLTYGTGNPLLLGTYQGYGYPLDEELDYKTNVDDKMSDEMRKYLSDDVEQKTYLKRYYLLEYDGMKARYRMSEWWKKDKVSMLKSYLIEKPKILIKSSFYWDKLFDVDVKYLTIFRKFELFLFTFFSLFLLIRRKFIKEWIFIMLLYFYHIALYSYTYAFSRYAITLYFLRYIIIGIGVYQLVIFIKEKRKKHESIDDHTSI